MGEFLSSHKHLNFKKVLETTAQIIETLSEVSLVCVSNYKVGIIVKSFMPRKNTNNMRRRGFASMDPEKRRRIASMGGRAAHANGKAHEFTSEEAREAGRKGGRA